MSSAPMKPLAKSLWGTLALTLGLLLVFLGERMIVSGTGRGVASITGGVLVVGAFVWRLVRVLRVKDQRRKVESSLLVLAGVALVGLVCYGLTSDLLSPPLSDRSKTLATILSALTPALLLVSLLPTWLTEAAYAAMVRAPVVEVERTRDALRTGLGFSFVLLFAFSAVYIAVERDVSRDFSYFRPARPSEATKKLVESLNAPLQVTLFYPPGNEVHEKLKQYFEDLRAVSPFITVESVDQAVDPLRARELGVNVNGFVVLSRDTRKELFSLNPDIDKVRGALKTLDGEIQKRLMSLVKAKRIVYLVSGHGEMSDAKAQAGDGTPGVTVLKEGLKSLNAEVRTLGAAEGLANGVPQDATVVFLLGPTSALLPEEVESLVTYARNGGRLWIALEPSSPETAPLLNPLGLELKPTILAHPEVYLPQTRQQSDRANLVTTNYSSHKSVSALARVGSGAPVAFLRAGSLSPLKPRPAEVTEVDVTVRAQQGTFADEDGDFTRDEQELSEAFPLVAAVELKGGGRAIVQSDSDSLGDVLLARNPTHRAFLMDGVRWLFGDEALVGGVSSEEDVPVVHTRKQDVWWFYGSVFLAPALVLGLGFAVTRKRARGARPSKGRAA